MKWQPNIDRARLQVRAQFISSIRSYFASNGVLEVDTPALSHAAATDPNILSLCVSSHIENSSRYLTTSPEFAMKRLLAAGSGDIYQLAHVFRDEPASRCHQPEFMLLEWYRTEFSSTDLIADVNGLLMHLGLVTKSLPVKTYRALWRDSVGDDLHHWQKNDFLACLDHHHVGISAGLRSEQDLGVLRQLVFTHVVEPAMPESGLVVTDYPADEASLATLKVVDGVVVADRFEVFINGMELANGFYELQNPNEQAARFAADNEARKTMGLPHAPMDTQLIDALNHGLPDCAGVAMGVDRLLMLKLDATHIDEVIPFSAGLR